MPCQKLTRPSLRSNLLLTVPDRLGNGPIDADEDHRRKVALTAWIGQYVNGRTKFRCVREPYKNPQAGFTHHYHVGLTWTRPTKWAKLWHHKNDGGPYHGIDFRSALTKRGSSADQIFSAYFEDPAKYKAIDEHGCLVYEQDSIAIPPSSYGREIWLDPVSRRMICDRLVAYYDRPDPCHPPPRKRRRTNPCVQDA